MKRKVYRVAGGKLSERDRRNLAYLINATPETTIKRFVKKYGITVIVVMVSK